MALSGNTVFEVRQGGSDTNGGGFVTGSSGTDWSQQNSAQYAATDGQTFGTTNFDSATANFGTDVVGNVIYIAGGTAALTAGWYQIMSRTSATRIVLDRTVATGTGATFNIGGALATPGGAGAITAIQNAANITIFVKYDAAPYIATTAATNVSGGCVLGQSNQYWVGYDLSRTRYPAIGGNRPTFQLDSGVSTAVLFTGTNNGYWLQNIILDCNNQSVSRGGLMSGEYFYVKAINGEFNATGGILQDNSTGRAILCEVANSILTSTASALRMSGYAFNCVVRDCTVASGNTALTAAVAVGCIAYNISGGNGIAATFMTLGCVAYNCTQAGFFPWNSSGTLMNCIAENNGTYGYAGNAARVSLIKCASYNNTSGRSVIAGSGILSDVDPIMSSASVFVNAAAGDLTLNSTAGAGADLRAAGFPADMMGFGDNYADVGALQHLDGSYTPPSPPAPGNLITLKNPILWPGHSLSGGGGSLGTVATLTSAGSHYYAYCMQADEDMTISHVSFRVGNVTTSGSVAIEVRIETPDASGLPSGVLWNSGTTNDSNAIASSIASNTSVGPVALGGAAVIPKGALFCVKLLLNTGTSVVIPHVTGLNPLGGSNIPYFVTFTGSASKASWSSYAILALGSSATDFYTIPGAIYASAASVNIFNSSVAGTKRGMLFTPPFNCRVIGFRSSFGAQTGNVNVMITDINGVELSNSLTAIDGDSSAVNSNSLTSYMLDNAVLLTAGTPYRALIEPTTTTNTGTSVVTLPSLIYKPAAPGGDACSYCYFTTAAGWTDSLLEIAMIDLLLDQIPDGIVGGGAGPVGQLKIFKGGTPY